MNDFIWLSYAGNVLFGGGWFIQSFFGGKKEYHQQVISQLTTLTNAQQVEIALLKSQNERQQSDLDRKEERITYLEEIIGEHPELVRARVVSRQQRTARRGRAADPSSTGNE